MAATAEAARLTEAHRLAQVRLGATTVAAMADVWPLLDPTDLAGTAARWMRPAVSVIAEQRAASARLAGNYLAGFKAIELGPENGLPLVVAEEVVVEQVVQSLLATGPGQVRRSMAAGVQLDAAMDLALSTSSAAAMRHALNGGRDTTLRTVQADPQAAGWARVTSAKPCAFCAMLASRGPVYRQRSAGFKAHDRCGCGAEPIYRPDAEWPAGSRRWERLWRDAKAAGGDTAKEFRRLVEAA